MTVEARDDDIPWTSPEIRQEYDFQRAARLGRQSMLFSSSVGQSGLSA